MKRLLALVIAIAVVAGLIVAYREMSQERTREAEREKPVSAPSRATRAADGSVVLTLEAETQQRLALTTANPAPATLDREVKAYGRVLDPAPLVALLGEIASARAALEASTKDFQRVKKLFEQDQNASARALETAEAAMKRDQIAAETAQTRLVSTWGRVVASQPELPTFVHSLATLETALVRLDLPPGETLDATPTGARLLVPEAAASQVEAQFLRPAPTTDPQAQGQGYLFVAQNRTQRLAPGRNVVGFLKLPGAPLQGVTVPGVAVVRAAGRAWVYVQTGPETFSRREVTLDRPVAGGWFVPAGLNARDKLVVSGAQALLSEELKSQIRMEE
jgi:hypothetical protein